MTAKTSLKISEAQMKGISVISLDAMKPAERLLPGEPREIAAGVTVSVMQSAAEALLEIQESANGSISIDNHAAHELATVRPGQIIKTIEGRYVLIRHLQAIIVPRIPGYQRPAHVESMIALAVASLEAPVPEEVEISDDTVMNAPVSVLVSAPAENRDSKKKTIRLAVMGAATVVVLGLCLTPFGKDPSGVATVAPSAKSRVIAAAEQSQSAAKSDMVAQVATRRDAPKASETSQIDAKQKSKNVSAVDALRTAMAAAPSAKKVSGAPATTSRGAAEGQNSRTTRLSEKDRQTVIEYKLEAKFDRAKARIKLRDMAKSFPVGSPARAEVERALGNM